MKATLVLNSAVWFLLAVKLGQSITCFRCDSETSLTCQGEMDATDCSLDPEYRDIYDSCFSLVAYNGKEMIQIKDCAMGDGCGELEEILCQSYNNADNSTEQRCRLECCKDDFCNDSARIQTILLSSFVAVCCTIAFLSAW